MPTIARSFSSDTISPYLVMGLSFTRATGNIIHEVLPSGPDSTPPPQVTYGKLSGRQGTLQFLCLAWADAVALEAFHNYTAGKWTLSNYAGSAPPLSYVLNEGGAVNLTLDTVTRLRWIATIDFREVP